MSGCSIFISHILWFKVEEIKTEQGLLQYLINCKKFQVQSWWLAEEGILQEVYNPSLCISLDL